MGEIINRTGLYWLSSNDDCEDVQLKLHTETIVKALFVRENKNAENTNLTTKFANIV